MTQPSASANGPYTAIPGNAAANAAQGGIMPSAGHYADMQTLMQNLDALSGWLQQNREEFEGVREGLRRVEGHTHPRNGGSLENGVEAIESEEQSRIHQLSSDLAASQTRITQLEATLASFQTLHTHFTTTLNETLRLIRTYTYNNQTHLTELHQHYIAQLQSARYETLSAQTTHQEWQESLQNFSETLRDVSKAREAEEEVGGLMSEVRGLRYENRFLRRKVGWDERGFTELEEEEIELDLRREEEAKERARQMGRESRGSLGVGDGGGMVS